MLKLLNRKIDVGLITNPFYLYCITFMLTAFLYFWGWSDLFPDLSSGLFAFLVCSFLVFVLLGKEFWKSSSSASDQPELNSSFTDILFWVIILMGLLNVILMGYLPVLNRGIDYRDFGTPVLDPLFNTLSIFFSVYVFQSFLDNKKSKYLIYIFLILIIQILLFRRSTIVWILTSATFLYVLRNPRVRLLYLIAAFVLIPVFSYGFGKYGAFRSNLSTSFIINDLEASAAFTNTGISPAHYLTYLYIASPLANLQKNIDDADGFLNKKDLKSFIFYAIVPESLTIRLARHLNLSPPECSLITHNLIVGSFFMVGFYTLGWPGMLGLLMFLVVFIFLCQSIITKWDTFRNTTSAILLTTVALLIFTNFLNRLDVILMLFIYPVLFHFLYRRKQDKIHQE